jgi:hypothetical protein
MPINNEPLIVQEDEKALAATFFNKGGPAYYDLAEAIANVRIKATSEAIERAAEVADRKSVGFDGSRQAAQLAAGRTAREIATAIRSLSIPGGEG